MTKQRITVNLRGQRKQNKPKKTTAIGKLIRAAGSAGGGYLGGLLGQQALGGAAGHQLGAMASRWLGFGDYQVTKNSILTKSADGIPYMHKEDQGIILRHKEFIGTLTGSQAFNVQYELPLNPGMTTFPWLSQIASRFQEYRFRGVVFHYIPASGAAIASTNSALGTVMIQTTYRPSDTAPASKLEMLNEYCANEVVPSDSVIHPIECDPKQNPFAVQFVRSVPVPSGESILNYDLGKTFVAVQGQQADGYYLGDLWATYEVELMKPVYSSSVTTDPISVVTYSGVDNSGFFNTLVSSNDTLGLIFSGHTVTFPANCGTTFTITASFPSSNVSVASWAATSGTNATITNNSATQVLSGAAQIMFYLTFTKTDPSKASVVTLPALTATVTTLDQIKLTVSRSL